ncbi:lysozyme [Verminephrobacter aporrectodeae subsp. tuberculatae]|uniref:glycoside hydrolase family protein n=1 Tax=Verminephrobacter aporrectodeae TaxID=1110389 RepID=UPI003908B8D2|nr:lysozyme [Verminephrobacter aporrectodeae subsp. tuberculatae]
MTPIRQNAARMAVALLTMSGIGFSTWQASEGYSALPIVPTEGDVPTIGHGSTRYEDGTLVRLNDPPITRQRAIQLAHNLHDQEEAGFRASLPGVALHQSEYDLYLDWVGQYGIGNWHKPRSPRTQLLQGNYRQACAALLVWRFQAGRDCSLPRHWGPKGCRGVWSRQQQRHDRCMEAQ